LASTELESQLASYRGQEGLHRLKTRPGLRHEPSPFFAVQDRTPHFGEEALFAFDKPMSWHEEMIAPDGVLRAQGYVCAGAPQWSPRIGERLAKPMP
jgi:hypothetical protein